MKKTLSLILALLMSASCASFAFADGEEEVPAISEDAAADVVTEENETIKFLGDMEIMRGYGDGDFGETDLVARYEMALIMGRLSTGWTDDEKWASDNSSEFTDLDGSYADKVIGALSYVNQKGIIVGYGDGRFDPENDVTYRDALTMAVRTLGFGGGYDYPWDYIEKAVGLGLTDGISGVGYTDPINRGVAAQIAYNTLFAVTSEKDTLADRSFSIVVENIMVTADTYGVLLGDEKEPSSGVAFRIFNEDGTLADTTYFVNDNIDGEALVLGGVYEATFVVEDDNYVELKKVYPYLSDVIKNEGITDDEGNTIDTPDVIGAFLGAYSLVDKYTNKVDSTKNTLNQKLNNSQIIIADAYQRTTVLKDKEGRETPYAIDWETGDILKLNDKGVYEVEWFYNGIYDYFFQLKEVDSVKGFKEDGSEEVKDKLVGINILDEDEIDEIKEAIEKALNEKVEVEADGYKILTKKPGYSAYAALEIYDLDKNGEDAEFAIYESYRFGRFSTASKKCVEDSFDANDKEDKKDDKHDAYVLESVSLEKVGGDNKENFRESWTIIADGKCDKCDEDEGHFAAGYEPSEGFTGYVIYGVNPTTKEIKIVKEIGAKGASEDADSYYATGVVRGNSISDKYVVIDGEKIYYDYEALLGSPFVKVEKNKAIYTDLFDKLFMQFVDYVVVDGKLVYINIKGEMKDEFIVVEGYYGIDTDNYIVISGYNTSRLNYETFRIGSVDGWVAGDAYWYDVLGNSLDRGSVLKITSMDADVTNGPVYNVTSLGNITANGDIDYGVDEKKEDVTITIVNGRRVLSSDEEGKTPAKVKNEDQYIIIGEAGSESEYFPIYVFNGKASNGWTVTGDILVQKDNLFIIVNAKVEDMIGFGDSLKTGFVAILDKKINKRTYDGWGDEDNYYIFGMTTYYVEAFDLVNIKDVEVIATNKDIKEGMIYRTIDNVIVAEVGDFADYLDALTDSYVGSGNSEYQFVEFDFVLAEDFDKKVVSKDEISKLLYPSGQYSYDDLIGGYTVRAIINDANGDIDDVKKVEKYDDVKSLYAAGTDTVEAFLVYDNKGDDTKGNVVVYLYGAEKAFDVETTETVEIKVADATLTADVTVSGDTVNGVYTEAAVTAVTLTWDVKGVKAVKYTVEEGELSDEAITITLVVVEADEANEVAEEAVVLNASLVEGKVVVEVDEEATTVVTVPVVEAETEATPAE